MRVHMKKQHTRTFFINCSITKFTFNKCLIPHWGHRPLASESARQKFLKIILNLRKKFVIDKLTRQMKHLRRHNSFYCELFSLYSTLLAGALQHLIFLYYLSYRDTSSYFHRLPWQHSGPQSKCLHCYNNHGRNTSCSSNLGYQLEFYNNLFPRKT